MIFFLPHDIVQQPTAHISWAILNTWTDQGGNCVQKVISSARSLGQIPWERKVLKRYPSAQPAGQYHLECMMTIPFCIYYNVPLPQDDFKYIWASKGKKLMRYQHRWAMKDRDRRVPASWLFLDIFFTHGDNNAASAHFITALANYNKTMACQLFTDRSRHDHCTFVLPSIHLGWYTPQVREITAQINREYPTFIWLDLFWKIAQHVTSPVSQNEPISKRLYVTWPATLVALSSLCDWLTPAPIFPLEKYQLNT